MQEDIKPVLLKNSSHEKKVIVNNLFNNLTEEAKLVVCAIIHTPTELSRTLFERKPTIVKIYAYMDLLDFKEKTIIETIEELSDFGREVATD